MVCQQQRPWGQLCYWTCPTSCSGDTHGSDSTHALAPPTYVLAPPTYALAPPTCALAPPTCTLAPLTLKSLIVLRRNGMRYPNTWCRACRVNFLKERNTPTRMVLEMRSSMSGRSRGEDGEEGRLIAI